MQGDDIVENSESANSGTPQIHYKRIEIAINSSDSAEKVRGDLIDGKYDEHIAACILLQQEQINARSHDAIPIFYSSKILFQEYIYRRQQEA